MRARTLLVAATATATVTGVLVIPNYLLPNAIAPKSIMQDVRQRPLRPQDLGPQIPHNPNLGKPSTGNSGSDGDLTISDILPTQRQINIFAGLTRDIGSLTSRLESNLPASNTTLLAPLNSAMKNLPRKPWEDRPDDSSGVSASNSEDKAAQNLKRFVLEHVVALSPWEEGQKVRTLWDQEEGDKEGREIWWEKRGGGDTGEDERKVIMPGEVVVDGIIGRVGNGEVWALRGVVNYE